MDINNIKKIIIILVVIISVSILGAGIWLFMASQSTSFVDSGVAPGQAPVTFPDTRVETVVSRLPTTAIITGRLINPPTPALTTLLDEVYLDVYLELQCQRGDERERSLMMTARYTQDPAGNHIRDAVAALQEWEQYILQDFGHILYPEVPNVESLRLPRFAPVPGTDFLSASVAVGNETVEVYYGWLLNYVFIAPSIECLEAAQFDVYAPHVH